MESQQQPPRSRRFCLSQLSPNTRPKLGMNLIKAARQCHDATEAARKSRRSLIASALERHADPEMALAVLNHLADEFGLPPFRASEIVK